MLHIRWCAGVCIKTFVQFFILTISALEYFFLNAALLRWSGKPLYQLKQVL